MQIKYEDKTDQGDEYCLLPYRAISLQPPTCLARLAILIMLVACISIQAQSELFDFSGDFRLRFERTTRQEPGADANTWNPRNRQVVRFRFGIAKKINGMFKFGARLATGSPEDPNTTDVTVGSFVNDLAFSLDRVFLEMKYRSLILSGGKFANPFRTTDLVWDGDVNPQGVAVGFVPALNSSFAPRLSGIYYMIDEQTSQPDSYMLGGQMQLSIQATANLGLSLAGAYYDYNIRSLISTDAGDTRSNYLVLNADSSLAYRSDFNLFDAIVSLEYLGLGELFPIRILGDFVKNTAAANNEDTGFAMDLFIGKTGRTRDFRFQYGYSQTETDAVLAAFSHDNTTIATNYIQHTFGLDYVVHENTTLNLTIYHYRQYHPPSGAIGIGEENKYFTRIRLNAMVVF